MLEPGDVFLLRDFRNTGYDPHYQIVVHKAKSGDLLLVYCTTELQKTRKRCARDSNTPIGETPSTYVEIPAGTCRSLPRECAVNCNKAFLSTESDRENGMDYKKRTHKLPANFLKSIEQGIRDSEVLDDYIKEILDL